MEGPLPNRPRRSEPGLPVGSGTHVQKASSYPSLNTELSKGTRREEGVCQALQRPSVSLLPLEKVAGPEHR